MNLSATVSQVHQYRHCRGLPAHAHDVRRLPSGSRGTTPLTTLYRLLKAGCIEATWLMVQALRGVLLLPTHRSTSILTGKPGMHTSTVRPHE